MTKQFEMQSFVVDLNFRSLSVRKNNLRKERLMNSFITKTKEVEIVYIVSLKKIRSYKHPSRIHQVIINHDLIQYQNIKDNLLINHVINP